MRVLLFISVIFIFFESVNAQKTQDYLRYTDDNTIFINSVRWEFSTSKLHDISYNTLDTICEFLKDNIEMQIDFTLYEQLEPEYSQDFLKSKVASIVEYFCESGIETKRIKGKGAYLKEGDEPIASFILMKFYCN